MEKEPDHKFMKKDTNLQKLRAELDKLQDELSRRRTAEEKWLLFMESAAEGFSLYDRDLNIIELNRAALNLFPGSPSKETLLGKNIMEFEPEGTKAKRIQGLKRVITTGEPYSEDSTFLPRGFGKSESTTINFKAFKVGDGVGIIITDITERKQLETQLRKREEDLAKKNRTLEETNIALKVLLEKREQDKKMMEEKILSNIKNLIDPCIDTLKKYNAGEQHKKTVTILESNLNEITSGFSHRLSSKKFNLTPMELKVANLVKLGKTSKEISTILNLASKTVSFHRNNIRKKLGINNIRSNLRVFLLGLA